jgi:long-chain fatty acid transport protein
MRPRRVIVRLLVAALLARAGAARGQAGVVLNGVGPVNQAMGGAATAAPLDAMGPVNWNPAAIAGLPRSEMDFALTLLYPHTRLGSRIDLGALAALVPPGSFPLEGSTAGDNKFAPLGSFALVYRPREDSRWTFGLGIIEVAGSSNNYPGDPSNPVLSPPPPHGVGLGPITATFDVLQLAPTVACWLTEHVAVGVAPTLDVALLVAEPALFARPDDANGDGFPTYPSASRPEFTWGAGAQAGVYCTTDACWDFGASVKSPQWFEPFLFHATNEVGQPRTLKVKVEYPAIASVGAAYRGLERWTFAADARWIDYRDARTFGQAGFEPDGAVRGVGWRSILVLALGAQFQATGRLTLRAGYSFNQDPVDPSLTTFNVGSPAVIEHALSGGASFRLTDALSLELACSHGFAGSTAGPAVTPLGTLPFVRLRSDASADFLLFGANVRF